MKKPFQILSTAITIILFSCGNQNAEIPGTVTNGVKELSIKSSSAGNESDLLLISPYEQTRFNADRRDQIKEFQDEVSARRGASYTIDRSGVTKPISKLNSPYIVN